MGQTVNFMATVRNASGDTLQSFPVTWSSDDPTIVSISADGYAKAVGVGTTTLRAKVDSLSAAMTVTIAGDPLVSISLDPGSKALSPGQTVHLAATLRDYNGAVLTGRPVVWGSTAPSVVMVDSNGTAKAIADGQAAVTATSAGIQATAFVTIGADTLPGKVSDLAATVLTDSSVKLTFTTVGDGIGHPASYDLRFHSHPIRWGSASEVSSGSCQSPVKAGSIGTEVTCTASGLADGTPYDFQLVAFRGIPNVDAIYGPLSNLAIASTPAGPNAPTSPGTPTSSGGSSGTQSSTAAVAASVTISPSSVTDTVGQGSQLSAVVKDSAGSVLTGHGVEWWTTDSSVVNVSSTGYVTAKGVGTANVIATSDSATGRAQVTVKLPPPPVTVATVSVSPASTSTTTGYRVQLTATAYDPNGAVISNAGFNWSTSNSSVATVSASGLVSAVGAGSATITASSGGKSGNATLTVNNPPVVSSGQGPFPNLPSGYTMPSNYVDEFTNSSLAEGIFTTDASHSNFTQRNASNYSPGGGVGAPVNPPASAPYIGEIRYPAGMSAGSAPSHLYASVSGQHWTHIYVAYTIQLSSNWYGQSSGTNKIGYVWMHANPSVFLVAHGQGTGSLRWEVDLQNVASGAARLTDNLGRNASVTRGNWQRVEMELIANTPGVANGIVRLWLTNYDANGNQVGAPVQILQYSNIEFAGSGQSNTWEQVTWYPIWGGVGGSLPVTQYQWMDQLAIAGQ